MTDPNPLEILALEQSRREAERKHIAAYSESPDPDRRLRAAIYEILAVTASSVLDRSEPAPAVPHPGWINQWPESQRTKLQARMDSDLLFYRLIQRQAKLIEEEIDAHRSATRKYSPEHWIRASVSLEAGARADEREACARLAETYLDAKNGTPEGCDIARLIRERSR